MFQESRRGAVTVLGTDDPLTVENVSEAVAILERCCQTCPPMAVMDLSRVPFVDSAAMELLLNAHEQFERRGGAFKVASPTRLCLDALQATGVADQLDVHDSLADAIRSYLR